MIKYVLIDIEGTLSDIQFVHNVLFPYSYNNMSSFLESAHADNNAQVVDCVSAIENEFSIKGCASVAKKLKELIDQDIKHPMLKQLQGMIWKKGFESGEFKAHLYPEVIGQLNLWKDRGLELGIYSSGSIAAQKLFFTHTEFGNISKLFSHHFDLSVGGKRESSSYQKITEQISLASAEVLFLSDVDEELAAAESVGVKVCRLIRPGTKSSGRFLEAEGFDSIKIDSFSEG